MTAGRRNVGFSLLLPPAWFIVPLADAPERERAVRALVDRHVGRADGDATRRRQARALLEGVARRAAGEHGTHLCLWLGDAVEARPSASLRISTVPISPFAGSPHGVALMLADGLEEPGVRQEIVELPLGPAVRRQCRPSRYRDVWSDDWLERDEDLYEVRDYLGDGGEMDAEIQIAFGPEADVFEGESETSGDPTWHPLLGLTVLQYVVPVPDSRTVLLFGFATPARDLADPLVGLFDVIASTLRWDPDGDAAEGTGGGRVT